MPVSRGEEKKDEEIFWFRLFMMQVLCQNCKKYRKIFQDNFFVLYFNIL